MGCRASVVKYQVSIKARISGIWKILAVVFLALLMLSAVAYAQDISSAIDFFMHGRTQDTLLRDHYRFEEPKPLRIEYWYINWLDTDENTDEYRDYIHIEGILPIYNAKKLKVDIPFHYSRIPVWAESEAEILGRRISIARPQLMARWVISNRIRSLIGLEYSLKGDDKHIGRPGGKKIGFLTGLFSYDLNTQLNLAAGMQFDRYYYNTNEVSDTFELTDKLYYNPAIMMNWHRDNLALLLGIPYSGVYLALGSILKAEARATIEKEVEAALRLKPVDRVNVTLRFTNIPYKEIPIKGRNFSEDNPLTERLYYTDRSILFEIGRELNPAALASIGVRYNPSRDVEVRDALNKKTCELKGKPYFSIGATFIMDLEALVQKR